MTIKKMCFKNKDTCEIDGVCYSEGESKPNQDLLVCNPIKPGEWFVVSGKIKLILYIMIN